MKKTTGNNLVAIAFLIFFIGIAIMSTTYGPRARLVPLPIAICSILLVSFQLYLQNAKNSKLNLQVDAGEILFGQKDIKKPKSNEERKNSEKKELASFFVVIVFLALIMILGVELAILVFVTGYFRLINKDKWLKSLFFGIGTLVFLHLLFVTFLNVHFYEGVFGSFL